MNSGHRSRDQPQNAHSISQPQDVVTRLDVVDWQPNGIHGCSRNCSEGDGVEVQRFAELEQRW